MQRLVVCRGERSRNKSGIIHQIAVANRHAFRRAGRAGSVHDINQVIRCARSTAVDRWGVFPTGLIAVDADHFPGELGKLVDVLLLGEHNRGSGFLDLVSQPWFGQLGVQWNKRSACLEDAQQSNDHLVRPVHAEADAGAGPHAPLAQLVSEAIGTAVELGIGKTPVAEYQGRAVRCPLRLRLEQLVDTRLVRVLRYGLVESLDNLPPLFISKDFMRANRRLGIDAEPFQQADIVVCDVLGLSRLERPGIVIQLDLAASIPMQTREFHEKTIWVAVQLSRETGERSAAALVARGMNSKSIERIGLSSE